MERRASPGPALLGDEEQGRDQAAAEDHSRQRDCQSSGQWLLVRGPVQQGRLFERALSFSPMHGEECEIQGTSQQSPAWPERKVCIADLLMISSEIGQYGDQRCMHYRTAIDLSDFGGVQAQISRPFYIYRILRSEVEATSPILRQARCPAFPRGHGGIILNVFSSGWIDAGGASHRCSVKCITLREWFSTAIQLFPQLSSNGRSILETFFRCNRVTLERLAVASSAVDRQSGIHRGLNRNDGGTQRVRTPPRNEDAAPQSFSPRRFTGSWTRSQRGTSRWRATPAIHPV